MPMNNPFPQEAETLRPDQEPDLPASAPGSLEGSPEPPSPAQADPPPLAEETLPPAGRAVPRAPETRTSQDAPVLTIDAGDHVETQRERDELVWHALRTSHITGHILTGTLDGVERTESGMTIAVVIYQGFRVAIPLKEMLFQPEPIPHGAEHRALVERQNRILASMLGAEIDFIVRGLDKNTRSVVASRRAAMLRKRQTFYLDTDDSGRPLIYEGRVVQARVVGVTDKLLRVEVFGVECAILARDLSDAWMGDARDTYSVGDRVLVRVRTIDNSDPNCLSITADVRSVSGATSRDALKQCSLQCRYAGQVTDARNGVIYIRLNNGANAIAHTCLDRRLPGRRDEVSFAVTRLDQERGVAVGIITRVIKQHL